MATTLTIIPARDAKTAAVLARVATRPAWTQVLAWNLGSGELTPGAWTNKRFRVRYCRLSPCGRFFLYTAADRGRPWDPVTRVRPFAGEDGGGIAISRLPWLAALTRVHSRGLYVEPIAGKHALSDEDQTTLFAKFDASDDQTPQAEASLFPHQPGWRVMTHQQVEQLPRVSLPTQRTSDTALMPVHAMWIDTPHTAPRMQIRLVVAWRLRRGNSLGKPVWSLVGGRQDAPPSTHEPPALRLPVTSAWMSPATGRVLTATADGMLSLYQPPALMTSPTSPTSTTGPQFALKLVAQHDLSDLTPKPVRPPAKAYAPLTADERR